MWCLFRGVHKARGSDNPARRDSAGRPIAVLKSKLRSTLAAWLSPVLWPAVISRLPLLLLGVESLEVVCSREMSPSITDWRRWLGRCCRGPLQLARLSPDSGKTSRDLFHLLGMSLILPLFPPIAAHLLPSSTVGPTRLPTGPLVNNVGRVCPALPISAQQHRRKEKLTA
jgi:hypothetical protein